LATALRSRYGEDDVVGLTGDEVRQVELDQGCALPFEYVEFLTCMGKRAGQLLVGTDVFYPEVLGLKMDALALLAEFGDGQLVASESVVFATHQGYQIYWMADVIGGDPPVLMYEEGLGVVTEWSSFSGFLWDEHSRL
jgi:hypothetical protein